MNTRLAAARIVSRFDRISSCASDSKIERSGRRAIPMIIPCTSAFKMLLLHSPVHLMGMANNIAANGTDALYKQGSETFTSSLGISAADFEQGFEDIAPGFG